MLGCGWCCICGVLLCFDVPCVVYMIVLVFIGMLAWSFVVVKLLSIRLILGCGVVVPACCLSQFCLFPVSNKI